MSKKLLLQLKGWLAMQNDYIPIEDWFECIVPNGNLFMIVPSDNGNCLVRYPFEYGNVVYVQN